MIELAAPMRHIAGQIGALLPFVLDGVRLLVRSGERDLVTGSSLRTSSFNDSTFAGR